MKSGWERPVRQFMTLIRSAFASGHAHLVAAPNGGAPEGYLEQCGWRKEESGEWVPRGRKIGWIKDEMNVFLDPSSSFVVAQRLARDQGERIPVTLSTLTKRLRRLNVLASADEPRETNTIRRTLEGGQHVVWHFLARDLMP